MPTSFKYKFKPKGRGYNVWVTRQKHKNTYRQSTRKSSSMSDAIIDGILNIIFK